MFGDVLALMKLMRCLALVIFPTWSAINLRSQMSPVVQSACINACCVLLHPKYKMDQVCIKGICTFFS